uniref:Sushi domain-containing protein n=1 Tax=Moschus moschiferus TaxID=68415 RepID=A0A8C6CZI9_MOSMO
SNNKLALWIVYYCGPPPDLQFAYPNSKLNNKDFKTGTTLKYTCLPGYSRISSSSVTCNDRGSWDYRVFCAKKQCRNLGDLLNGKVEVKTDFLFGSSVEFSCSEGYILVGSATSHCEIQDKGVDWSDPLPQCIIVKCEPPPTISNGRHNGGDEDFYTYGSSVTYSCDPDFSMLGKASISCRVENKTVGVWSPSPPSCKIPNGNILSEFRSIYHYEDSVLFSCKKGYILNGSNLIHCGADDEWHPSPPTCELSEYFTSEDHISYTCDGGYNPVSPDGTSKQCAQKYVSLTVTCLKPEVENGKLSVDKEKYVASENVTVQCNPGFSLVGPQSITCSENTTWHPTVPTCHWYEWVIFMDCEQVLTGRKLMQCLLSLEDVKMALEVYKLPLEIEGLDVEKIEKE